MFTNYAKRNKVKPSETINTNLARKSHRQERQEKRNLSSLCPSVPSFLYVLPFSRKGRVYSRRRTNSPKKKVILSKRYCLQCPNHLCTQGFKSLFWFRWSREHCIKMMPHLPVIATHSALALFIAWLPAVSLNSPCSHMPRQIHSSADNCTSTGEFFKET